MNSPPLPCPVHRTVRWVLGLLVAISLGLFLPKPIQAEHDHICRLHGGASAFGIDLEGHGRRYAPDRVVDVLHIRLDVTPDFQRRSVHCTTTLRVRPIVQPVEQLRLDAVDLQVTDVRADVPIAEYVNSGRDLVIRFERPIPVDQTVVLHIDSSAEPRRGLYFRTPEMGYRPEDTQIWTQGEAHEARFWFPCFDYPNEQSTTEVICHIPQDMVAISNGRKLSETIEANGLKRVHWLQDKPHVNYLICLVAGYFEKLEDRHRDIPLGFYTPPSLAEHAANSFQDTRQIIAYFEEEIGVPFPWDKYDQAVILDFIAGGMENTTLTTLTHRTIFPKEMENVRTTRRLDAHETAHQWFGDYVTCKDWSHLWLNEGFATYYTHLYEGHKFGRPAMLYGLYRDARGIVRNSDRKPIVYNQYRNASEQFDYRAYPKGSWVLHMLRTQVGEDAFRRSVRSYLLEHAHESVVTDDLRQAFEAVTGRPLDQFFDQWVYHGGNPKLEVRYRWLTDRRMAHVHVKQTQKVDDDVLLFRFPTTLRFWIDGEKVDHPIEISRTEHDFYVPLSGAPTIVRFDPEVSVLAEVQFNKSDDLLIAQLRSHSLDEADAVGRVIAAEALAKRATNRSIEALAETLGDDPFFGVRIAAAKSLAQIGKPESDDALWQRRDQPDARVRLAVAEAWAGRYRQGGAARIIEALSAEKNPAIRAVWIRALGRYHDDEARAQIVEYLDTDSFGNVLRNAAVAAAGMSNEASLRQALRRCLESYRAAYDARGLATAVRTLSQLAEGRKGRRREMDLFLPLLESPYRGVRSAAVEGLGRLGLREVEAILEPLAADNSPDPEVRGSAEAALKRVRREAPAAPREVVELRNQLGNLRNKQQSIEKELQQVREQLKALRGASAEAAQK